MAASRTCVFKGASTCVIKQPPVARTDWQPAADGVRTAVLSPTRRVSRRGLTQANLSPGFPGRFTIDSRSPVVGFCQCVSSPQRFHLAYVDVQPPEPPGRFSLRLDVYSPSQVLQIDGCLYHLTLASHFCRR